MSIKNGRSEPKEILGLNRITKKRLLELCKKDKLYQTPSLNDVLYLHYQGFQCIECLEDYTELKCLWLECNALSEIQGLENQTKLKCLFLQSNLIKKIENLESCKELDTINLSQNQIRKIENINSDVLPVLNTLNLSSNYIKDCEGLKELENCKNLSVVDLSNNRIDDILVVKIFAKIPELKVLILQGNPVVSKIPQYRKTLILECKNLTYLDSRPVFPKDRACAEAWKRGGYQEERKENERWNRKERKKIRDGVNATIRMRNRNRKPEDHLTLLVSSDSDDESAVTKRKRQQQEQDAGVSMELGIWDEVAGDDTKSETASSSDMNVSSSTSVISTTDSNGDTSNTSFKEEEECQRFDNEEMKILNVPMKRKDNEPCQLDENKNMDVMAEIVGKGNLEETTGKGKKSLVQNVVKTESDLLENAEAIQLDASEIAEESGSNKDQTEFNQDEDVQLDKQEIGVNICSNSNGNTNDSQLWDKGVQKDGGYGCMEEFEKLEPIALRGEHNTISEYNTSDESEGAKETYDHTIEAIYRLTMNDLADTDKCPKDSERRVHLQIETNDENYEPVGEMEDAMKTMTTKEDVEREKTRELNAQSNEVNLITFKTEAQLEFEQECLEVNAEVRKDFEQMSSNMDVAIAQFQRDQEQRQEVIEALFSQKEANQEISSGDSGDEAKEAYEENLRIERMVNQWDRETKLKGGKKNDGTVSIELGEQLLKSVANYSFEGYEQKVVQKDYNHPKDGLKQIDFTSIKDFTNLKELDKKRDETENLSKVFERNDGNQCNKEKSKYDQKQNNRNEMAFPTSEEEKTESEGVSSKSLYNMGNMSCVSEREKEKDPTEILLTEDNRKSCSNKYEENAPNIICREGMEESYNTEDTTKSHAPTGCLIEFDNIKKYTKVLRVGQEPITGKIHQSLKKEPENNNITNSHDEDFYKPLDVTSLTRVSNDALESFEKEAKQLKDLLQKLEDDNGPLFSDFISETQHEKEENTEEFKENGMKTNVNLERTQELQRENNIEVVDKLAYNSEEQLKGKSDSTPDDMPLQEKLTRDAIGFICEQTVVDIIQSLDLKHRKPASFEFPVELEEDHMETRVELPLSKTIRNVIDSFNGLFTTKTSPNPITSKDQSCGVKTVTKTAILNELANSSNLKQFNQDTHESLDVLLTEYKEERSKEVRRIVDRVYAQKDRYDDTLELVDGKLMVVHKETAELTELQQCRSHPLCEDSDTDYDTAESGEEEDGACCSKPRVRSRVNVWPQKWGPYTLADYKPGEVLMHQALGSGPSKAAHRNNQSNEESNEEDEYYSMDTQNVASVYGNIDREIFDAMNFDHLNLSEQDESHIVQCVRSYEELRHLFKTQKAERGLTPEENELLEKMVETRQPREEGDQQHLLRKLMERTRECTVTDKEYPKPPETLNDIKTGTPYKISREPITLLEYKPTINVGNEKAPGERKLDMCTVRDARLVENECTEIYGDDVFTFIHDEFAENREEEAKDLYRHESLKSKKVKENLNRKEQQTENAVSEIRNVESISGIVLCSEDEKNEIEYNIDAESVMRKTELVAEENSIDCNKNNVNQIYTALTSEAVCVSQRITMPGNTFEDTEQISRDLKEISNFPTKQSNDIIEKMSQLKETKDELKNIPNSNNEFQNAHIRPLDVVQSLTSALTRKTLSNSLKVEQIPQICIEECHPSEMTDVGSLECRFKIQECENNFQEYLNISEFVANTSHMEDYYENINNENQMGSPSHVMEVASSEVTQSNHKAGELDTSSNYLPSRGDLQNQNLTPLSTMTGKDIPDVDLLKYNSTELLDSDSNPINVDPQPQKELPDVENKSPETLEVDILECNLEILECNEDVIDTITVNAEIHYENCSFQESSK